MKNTIPFRFIYNQKNILFLLLLFLASCKSNHTIVNTIYNSESLVIQQLTTNTFIHTTFLESEKFGKVPCNGALFQHNDAVIIFDTPTSDSVSRELIDWVTNELRKKVVGVVITHYHIDCLGGLSTFHEAAIPSYAHQLTINRLKGSEILPQYGFIELKRLNVGDKQVTCYYYGEGHTPDNIVCVVPSESVLFGGCLIKSMGAGKGNLDDANVTEWSDTVRKLQKITSQYRAHYTGAWESRWSGIVGLHHPVI